MEMGSRPGLAGEAARGQPRSSSSGRMGLVTAVVNSFTLYCSVNLSADGETLPVRESVGQLQNITL